LVATAGGHGALPLAFFFVVWKFELGKHIGLKPGGGESPVIL